MAVTLDVTPSEFIYDVLQLSQTFRFTRYRDRIYLIDEDTLLDNVFTPAVVAGIMDSYDASKFNQEFGCLTSGLLKCLEEFARYFAHDCDDNDVVYELQHYFGAKLHPSWIPGIHRAFASSSPDRLYDIFEPYFFFYSDKFELICRVAKEGAIFAPEVVPLATEDELIALDVAGAFD